MVDSNDMDTYNILAICSTGIYSCPIIIWDAMHKRVRGNFTNFFRAVYM